MAIENIASDAGSASDARQAVRGRDGPTGGKASQHWLERAEIQGALGEAYGQLGEYEKAIDWFERASACEPAYQRVRTLERLVNFRTRWAAALHASGGRPTRGKPTAAALHQTGGKAPTCCSPWARPRSATPRSGAACSSGRR
ncbi:MAG: tetratricopeptide repeat protein [Bryobacterales bacterium]